MARRPNTKQAKVAASLRERIATGELAPGQMLPSEADLITQFGFARTTVREGIEILEDEGLVEPRQGLGVFVYDPGPTLHLLVGASGQAGEPSVGVAEAPPPFALEAQQGTAVRVGFHRDAPASKTVAELIEVAVGAPTVVRGFTEYVDGRHMLMSVSYLPAELANKPPAINPAAEDLAIGQLALVGRAVTRDGPVVIAGRPPTTTEIQELNVIKGVSLLVITSRVLVDVDGDRPVQAAVQVVARGDRVKLKLPDFITVTP